MTTSFDLHLGSEQQARESCQPLSQYSGFPMGQIHILLRDGRARSNSLLAEKYIT